MATKRITQRDRVIDYIQRFGKISSWDAYRDLGVTQLATRISELKARGYVFSKKRINTKTRFGTPTHYDEYYLVEAGNE